MFDTVNVYANYSFHSKNILFTSCVIRHCNKLFIKKKNTIIKMLKRMNEYYIM